MVNIKEEKGLFLFDEFFTLSINGAFQRNHIYNTDKERDKFKNWLKDKLINKINEYKKQVTDEHHIENIRNLKQIIEKQWGYILVNGQITFGTCQKLFNLFLKYIWAVGIIEKPPHCPFDSIIISKLPKIKDLKYSCFTKATENDYKNYIKGAKEVANKNGLSIAEWELILFNRS